MTKLSFILVFALVPLFAQTNTVAGAGYSFPVPLNVAPGQVITLFVDGIGASLTQTVRAPAGPLPLTLAGISVTLKQSSSNTPVPLLSVQPFSTLTAVTVQIPFELPTLCPLCERPSFPAPQLLVAENGRTGAAIDLTPLADQLHILTSCDPLFPNAVQRINLTGLPCAPMITHADGSLVSAAKPAKAGEELVAYAVGLGLTNPFVETGKPAAAPAATVQAFTIDYNYRPNALATKPLTFPNIGDPAPSFTLTSDDGRQIALRELRGQKIVLYFYPKDDTPGCTNEACTFRDNLAGIKAKNAVVIGVSIDSVESHQKFKSKYSLNFALLSDSEKKAVSSYGVWKQKSMYGRTYMGTERSTFIIDEQGKILRIFSKVSVQGHVDAVLAALG